MPFDAAVYRVLIASPSDVTAERDLIESVIHRWNADHAEANGVVLMPQRWENNAVPELGDRPQAIINRQLVDDADMIIGVFWTRLGTPTGVAASGTAEEIERAHEADKPVLVYFSKRPAVPETIDNDQLASVREFHQQLQRQGLVSTFEDLQGLERAVASHLTAVARDRFGASAQGRGVTVPGAPKASLRAEVASSRNSRGFTDYSVIVSNVGAGMATQVTIEPAAPEASWGLLDADSPVEFVPPGSSFRFAASPDYDSPMRVTYILRWSNEDGSRSELPTTLSL